MTEDQARDSALMGLASLTSSAIGLENSEALKRLPEQLATSGEACAPRRDRLDERRRDLIGSVSPRTRTGTP